MIITVPLKPIEKFYKQWGCVNAYFKRMGINYMVKK